MREVSDAGDDKPREPATTQKIPSLHIGPEEPSETRHRNLIPEPKVVRGESAERRQPPEELSEAQLLWETSREQISIVPPRAELTSPSEVRRASDSNRTDHLVESLMVNAVQAMLWKSAQLALDAVAPGTGAVVRVTKIISEFRGAVKTYEEGQGFFVSLPLLDLPGHDFSASLRLRAFATDAPPGLPVALGFDYMSTNGQLDKFNVVEGAEASSTNEVGRHGKGLDPLFRHAQQLSAAAGVKSSEFRVAYLHQPTRTGWVVVQPFRARARCEAWFNYKLVLSLDRQVGLRTTCPLCGRARSNEHECTPSDACSSGGLPVSRNRPLVEGPKD